MLGQLGFEKYVAFSTVTFAGKFCLQMSMISLKIEQNSLV